MYYTASAVMGEKGRQPRNRPDFAQDRPVDVARLIDFDHAMRVLLDYLGECGFRCDTGLSDAALEDLEQILEAPLPVLVRHLYRTCGGMDSRAIEHLPMRLMPPSEVINDAATLRKLAETYRPSPQARYLFTDDGSNWAGVYVAGPLLGKVAILDHDESSPAPRFRDVASFIEKMIEAGRARADRKVMRTDYPLTADTDEGLAAEALPLARCYLDQYRAAVETDDVHDALVTAETAMHLLPVTQWQVLRDLLQSPYQYVRWTMLRIAAVHKPRNLVPDIFAYAQATRADNNYTHWKTAFEALMAIGASSEMEALRRDVPSSWPVPGRAAPEQD